MRFAPTSTAALLAFFVLAPPALAFDVQNGGGQAGGYGQSGARSLRRSPASASTRICAPSSASPTISAAAAAKSGLQFGARRVARRRAKNPTSMGYDESPWVAPRHASRAPTKLPS